MPACRFIHIPNWNKQEQELNNPGKDIVNNSPYSSTRDNFLFSEPAKSVFQISKDVPVTELTKLDTVLLERLAQYGIFTISELATKSLEDVRNIPDMNDSEIIKILAALLFWKDQQ